MSKNLSPIYFAQFEIARIIRDEVMLAVRQRTTESSRRIEAALKQQPGLVSLLVTIVLNAVEKGRMKATFDHPLLSARAELIGLIHEGLLGLNFEGARRLARTLKRQREGRGGTRVRRLLVRLAQ